MEAPHAPVVGRRIEDAEHGERAARGAQRSPEDPLGGIWAQVAHLDARRLPMLGEKLAKRSFGNPDAIARRIQVDEEAEDAIAVGRAVCPRVDVDQFVGGVPGKVAPFLFEGPEAARSHPHPPREGGHRPGEEGADPRRMSGEDAAGPFLDPTGRLQPGQAVRLGIQADVLARQERRKRRAQELLIVRGRQRDGGAREANDLAALERAGKIAVLLLRGLRHRGRGP